MLPVAELKVGHEDYWLREVADSLCDYYAGHGESPGIWLGDRAEAAGIADHEATAEEIRAMFAGKDPVTGEQLAQPLWRADPRSKLDSAPVAHALRQLAGDRGLDQVEALARSGALRREVRSVLRSDRVKVETVEQLARTLLRVDPAVLYGEAYAEAARYRGKRVDARVAVFDLCFAEAKSVSLLLAGGDERVRREGNAARTAALKQALRLLQDEALGVRRGHNGLDRQEAVGGLLAGAYVHRTNREGEPHWHTHLLVQNLLQGPDRRWSAIDSRRAYAWFMAVDHIYQAGLRAELSHRLGVRCGPVDERTGHADILGLDDPALLRSFSTRAGQVAEQKQEWAAAGLDAEGIKAGSIAARATRKPKPRDLGDGETIYDRWRAQLADRGVGPREFTRVLDHPGRVRPAGERQLAALLEELAGPGGLTAQASTFARRDVLDAVAKRLPLAGSAAEAAEQVKSLADRFLDSERVVRVARERGLDEARWSTVDLVDLERELLATAEARVAERAGPLVDAGTLAQALAEHPTAGQDQAGFARDFTRGDGVVCGIGPAGFGKTFSVKVFARACQLGGVEVQGLAPTGDAAQVLGQEAGIPAQTVASFLVRLHSRAGVGLPAGSVLVVDEAGQVGTRHLATLLEWAGRAGMAVRLVGDHRQLSSIDVGGGFRALCLRLGAAELTDNRRQHDQLGRQVAALLREGQYEQAFAVLQRHGKVTVCRSPQDTDRAQVGDWWQAYTRDGTLPVGERGANDGMIVFTCADADRLNAAAHELMRTAGRLGPDMLTVNDVELAVGDWVVCGKNARRRLGVVNGTRGWVTGIDQATGTVQLDTMDEAQVTLPGWYVNGRQRLSGRRWLDLGYCVVGHKTQGRTLEASLVRGDRHLTDQWLYTAGTRHTRQLRLYLTEQALDVVAAELHVRARDPRSAVEGLLAAARRSGEQQLATSLAEAELSGLTAQQLEGMRDEELRRLAEELAARRGPQPPDRAEQLARASEYRQAVEREAAAASHARPAGDAHTAAGRGQAGRWFGWHRTAGREQAAAGFAVAGAARRLDQAVQAEHQLRRHQQRRTAWQERFGPLLAQEQLLAAELDWRAHAAARALTIERLPHLLRLLGEVPAEHDGRRAWGQLAERVEAFRQEHQIRDPEHALGPEPALRRRDGQPAGRGDLAARRQRCDLDQAAQAFRDHQQQQQERARDASRSPWTRQQPGLDQAHGRDLAG